MIKLTRVALVVTLYILGTYSTLYSMNEDKDLVVKYYSTFVGYSIPIVLDEEITEKIALEKIAYLKAYYNSQEILVKVEKYLHNKLFFQHFYSYRKNGKIEKYILVNEKGDKTTHHFDEKGKLLK